MYCYKTAGCLLFVICCLLFALRCLLFVVLHSVVSINTQGAATGNNEQYSKSVCFVFVWCAVTGVGLLALHVQEQDLLMEPLHST